jgi:hypothetical protein
MFTAGQLRGLGEEGLTALLRRRSEALAVPAPESLAELAERLAGPLATVTALRRLDRPTLQVAEAIAALGGEVARPVLERLLGADRTGATAAVSRALDALRSDGLARGDDVVRLSSTAAGAWPMPLGLGEPAAAGLDRHSADSLRSLARNLGIKPAGRKADILAQVVAALCDERVVRPMVASAPADVRRLLEKAASGEPIEDHVIYGTGYGRRESPVRWAVDRGLLVRGHEWNGDLAMPAEAALIIRGPGYTAPFDPQPPPVVRSAADPGRVQGDAAAAGAAAVRVVAALLELAGRAPLPLLKNGGLGLREVRRAAKALGCTEGEARLAVALTLAAGLLAFVEGRAVPTGGFDVWLRGEPVERLSALLATWWRLPFAPSAGDAAMAAHESDPGTAALRAALLRAAADPAGTAVGDVDALTELAVWHSPFAFGDPETVHVRAAACWREAAALGAVAAGAVTAVGVALLNGGDLAEALGTVGAAQRSARIQADLTAVAANPGGDLTALLDLAAEAEQRGVAYTWRFTQASIRRAFDAGHTAATLIRALEQASTGGLPQPLRYLVDDVARRHGSVRALAVQCCLRSDDHVLLAEIVADRRLRPHGLRLLAPTVAASSAPLPDVLAALRKAGYAPVAENDDGTAVLERAPAHRAAAAAPRAGGTRRAGAPAPDPAAVAKALLAAPDEAPVPSTPTLEAIRRHAHLTMSEARMLAHAIDHGLPATIGYVNRDGNASTRTIEEIELSGGSLDAWCRLREDQRWFNLSRIAVVLPDGEESGLE